MIMLQKLKRLLIRLGLLRPEEIHYIGGSDTLPPPLTREREAELLANMDEAARQAVTMKQVMALGREYGLVISQADPDTVRALTPGQDALSVRSSVCVLESLLAPLLTAASGRTAYRLTGTPGALRLVPDHSHSSSTTALAASSSL